MTLRDQLDLGAFALLLAAVAIIGYCVVRALLMIERTVRYLLKPVSSMPDTLAEIAFRLSRDRIFHVQQSTRDPRRSGR